MITKYIFGVAAFALVIMPAGSAEAMTTEEFLSQIEQIEETISVVQARLEVASAQNQAALQAADPNLEVFVNNSYELGSQVSSEEEAYKQCEAVAFNTDHMWLPVKCVFDGNTIYHDIFVAG